MFTAITDRAVNDAITEAEKQVLHDLDLATTQYDVLRRGPNPPDLYDVEKFQRGIAIARDAIYVQVKHRVQLQKEAEDVRIETVGGEAE